MTANQKFSRFIGIDVSKAKLDIYDDATGEFLTVENTAKAIEKYVSALSPDPELLIVVDLTGGYEALCVNTFYNRGFTVHRAEGRRVKAFMRSYGEHAKTDRIDAYALALFGRKLHETLRMYTPLPLNLNNPDGNFDIPRMVRPEVHRAISAGTRQNINEIVGMIGRGEIVSLKMVDRDNREIPFTNIEAVPHIARRRERSPLNPAEIDRLVNELSIISDAIQKVGINGREKKILADFMQGALYSRLIERNIPSTMPMFLDNHQGR